MTTTHGTERAVKTANHCTLSGRRDDTRSLYATTNHASRDMKKVKEIYVPTKRKRLDIKEKDLRMKVCCIATIDDVVRDQEGKEESDIVLKRKVKKN